MDAEELRTDPQARAELEAARSWGVSWSVFTGQEPPGSCWTAYDREGALALVELERLTCGGCGGFLPETTDAGNADRYRVGLPIRCHRCTHLEIARDAYTDSPQAAALMFHVELAPLPEPVKEESDAE